MPTTTSLQDIHTLADLAAAYDALGPSRALTLAGFDLDCRADWASYTAALREHLAAHPVPAPLHPDMTGAQMISAVAVEFLATDHTVDFDVEADAAALAVKLEPVAKFALGLLAGPKPDGSAAWMRSMGRYLGVGSRRRQLPADPTPISSVADIAAAIDADADQEPLLNGVFDAFSRGGTLHDRLNDELVAHLAAHPVPAEPRTLTGTEMMSVVAWLRTDAAVTPTEAARWVRLLPPGACRGLLFLEIDADAQRRMIEALNLLRGA